MKQERSDLAVMLRLAGLARPMLPLMALAVVLGVLGFTAATAITLLGAYGILAVLEGTGRLTGLLAAAAACALLRGFLRYGEQLCNHHIAFKLLATIRGHVFEALRRLAPAKLEGRGKGNLIAIITGDIELLEVFYAHTLSPVCIAAVMTLVMTAFIGRFHVLLGVLALAAYTVVGVLLPLYTARRARNQGEAVRGQLGELNTYVLESLRGIDTSIQYHDQPNRQAGMARRSEEIARAAAALKVSAGKNTALTNTAISLASLAMLGAGLLLHRQGAIPFSAVLITLVALISSFGPTAALSGLGAGLRQTLASGNRVLDLLDERPVVAAVSGAEPLDFAGADCRKVTFAYGAEDVLTDISVTIPKGAFVGITGKSGSGKSTLLKLLMRFWDADSGQICLSGRDIRGINTADLRAAQGLVTQETVLFHDTIDRNIRIGRLGATRQQVIEAARKAAIHDFIVALPQGYDTNVGELGDRLSGGERQRIGLARAFLHNGPLLLLDEPTSNLDSLSEAVILRALESERGRKTVVLVSHRKSTMTLAHKVYSVDRGRVC